MKKNGFTIIELVIIIGLLMVVVGIFSVNFIRTINSQKRTANENLISQVVSSANAYVSLYPDTIKALYEDATYIDITIGTLRDNGLLSEKLIDSETGENISDDEIVRIRFNGAGVLDIKYPVTTDDRPSTDDDETKDDETYYTLTFMDGTSVHDTRQVKSGTTSSNFPNLIKTGYTFDGWYTAASGGSKMTSITMNSNQTLYAKWIKVEEDLIQKIKNQAHNCSSINYANPATTDEGVCTMQDDYGTSYFYRGAVKNNYVKFAGFYWRIIRINGDGSVRIRYDGTQAHANGTNTADRFTHKGQAYNVSTNDSKSSDNKYVGWMYGPAGTTSSGSKAAAQTNSVDSDLKKVVDAWYKTNIVDPGYSVNVADAIFCNDRSTPGSSATGLSGDTGLGYGKNKTAYGPTARLGAWNSATVKTQPSFVCPNKNDAFTVSDKSKGNGALTYPVGLITADEIVAAGSGKKGTTNQSYYLYNPNSESWSISPSHFIENCAAVLVVHKDSHLSDDCTFSQYYFTDISAGVVPVINLKANYFKALKGTGTMTDPYRS